MNNDLIDILLNISIWSVVKIFILVALAIYLVFAVVVIRQVNTMTKVVSGELDIPLKILSWFHLLITLIVISLAVIVL